jgi:hypothetical protein
MVKLVASPAMIGSSGTKTADVLRRTRELRRTARRRIPLAELLRKVGLDSIAVDSVASLGVRNLPCLIDSPLSAATLEQNMPC